MPVRLFKGALMEGITAAPAHKSEPAPLLPVLSVLIPSLTLIAWLGQVSDPFITGIAAHL